MRLALLRIVRRGLDVEQVDDVGDLLVLLELVLLGGGSERDRLAVGDHTLEQLPHGGKRPDAVKITFLEQGAAAFFELFAKSLDLLLREEDRHELVAALSDLPADIAKPDLVPEFGKGIDPGLGMDVDRIDERSVDVEDDGLERTLLCIHAGLSVWRVIRCAMSSFPRAARRSARSGRLSSPRRRPR